MSLAERDYVRERKPRGYRESSDIPPVKTKIPWNLVIVFIFGVLVGVSLGGNLSKPSFNQPLGKPVQLSPPSDVFLSEQPLPANGSYKMFYSPEKYVSNFSVTADSKNHYFVKLVDGSNNPVLYLFVRAHSTADIKAPLGIYEIRWVSGEKWYGFENLFGRSSRYQKALKTLDFYEKPISSGKQTLGHSITFNNVINGNLPSTSIGIKDF